MSQILNTLIENLCECKFWVCLLYLGILILTKQKWFLSLLTMFIGLKMFSNKCNI